MTYEEFISDYSHVAMCLTHQGQLIHFVGFTHELSYEDKVGLIDELTNDEQLGMSDLAYGKDYIIKEMSTMVAAPFIKQIFDEMEK